MASIWVTIPVRNRPRKRREKKKAVTDTNMTHPWSRGRGTLEEATKIQTSPPSTISRQTKAPE